ncbi:MAG: glycosyltransferase family protein [Cuniculiplasma sp.]
MNKIKDEMKNGSNYHAYNEKKSALIMVTYNEVPKFDCLRLSLKYVDYVFIIDNNSRFEVVESIRDFVSHHSDKIFLQVNLENLGLSIPINSTVRSFREKNIFWFYVIDQDAIFDARFFEESLRALRYCLLCEINLGIVVPIVGDKIVLLGENLNIKKKYSFIRSAITSGIMTNVNIFESVGGFDESLFVYGTDIDFTIRVHKSGHKICRINKVLIVQQYGVPLKIITLRSKIFFKMNKINSLINLRFNAINSFISGGYYYRSDKILDQIESNRLINRRYRRIIAEIYRLIQKYATHRVHGGKK